MIDFDPNAISQHLYKLDENNNPIHCSLREWGELYRTKEGGDIRCVAFDVVNDFQISTVFVGIDQGFYNEPLLFETMIFKGKESLDYCDRYTTWDAALEGHKEAIEWVKNECKDD